jgi:hypothetical protein
MSFLQENWIFSRCCKQRQNKVNAVIAKDEVDSSQLPSEKYVMRYIFANKTDENNKERRSKIDLWYVLMLNQ